MASLFKRHKIEIKTLGQKLKTARLRKKFNFDEIEEATKIRARYLDAMERDDYRALPGPVYLPGYLTRYANFLGLPAANIVAQYRHEQGRSLAGTEKKHFRTSKELEELRFTVTPRTFIVAAVALLVVGLTVYVGWQVRKFSAPPPVNITSPTSDSVSSDEITIQGETYPTATVTINGQSVGVDINGEFSQKVGLSRGVNNIEIKAGNRAGRSTAKVLKIFADFAVPGNPPA